MLPPSSILASGLAAALCIGTPNIALAAAPDADDPDPTESQTPPTSVPASNPEPPSPEPEPTDAANSSTECTPRCREGFVCEASSCVPECATACANNEVCIDHACVSACNPLCTAGEVCTVDGECIADLRPSPEQIAAQHDRLKRSSRGLVIGGATLTGAGAALLAAGLAFTIKWRTFRGETLSDHADFRQGRVARWRTMGLAFTLSSVPVLVGGVAMLVIGKTKAQDLRRQRVQPTASLGRNGATLGVRMRF